MTYEEALRCLLLAEPMLAVAGALGLASVQPIEHADGWLLVVTLAGGERVSFAVPHAGEIRAVQPVTS